VEVSKGEVMPKWTIDELKDLQSFIMARRPKYSRLYAFSRLDLDRPLEKIMGDLSFEHDLWNVLIYNKLDDMPLFVSSNSMVGKEESMIAQWRLLKGK
jgi:hypothetical protein